MWCFNALFQRLKVPRVYIYLSEKKNDFGRNDKRLRLVNIPSVVKHIIVRNRVHAPVFIYRESAANLLLKDGGRRALSFIFTVTLIWQFYVHYIYKVRTPPKQP